MDDLTPPECRVLGSLIEKAATVPDTYPMTLNALRSACNQKSSRDPVVDHPESTVVEAADALRAKGLVRLVHQPGGRASKYRHLADETLTLDEPSLAVVAVLLLRGPQTVGELRTRSERIFEFDALDAVHHVLDRLASREQPLVRLLPRRPGQKDARWVQLLGGDVAETLPVEPDDGPGPARPAATDDTEMLRDRLAVLERRFDQLLRRLGEEIGPDGS